MILAIILFTLGMIVIFVGCYLDNKDLFESYFWVVVIGMLTTILSALIVMPISTYCYDTLVEPEKTFVEYEKTEIYSIGNEVGIEGHFVLGSGSIESEMYYFYYVGGQNGGIIIDKVKAENVEIIEQDIENAYIISGYMDYVNPNYFWTEGNSHCFATEYTRILVPRGTIKYSYNIQLG